MQGLNESPYEKVGKFGEQVAAAFVKSGLNESPYEKVGKSVMYLFLRKKIICLNESPYEKVGKFYFLRPSSTHPAGLNESPYEKVGKCNDGQSQAVVVGDASMKVPTKK